MAALFEAYRPRTLADVVGQTAAVKQVRAVLSRGWGGCAWWITGPSGTGKTTLARIIAAEGADEIAVEELDAQRLTPAKVREIVLTYASRCLFGKGWSLLHRERGPRAAEGHYPGTADGD